MTLTRCWGFPNQLLIPLLFTAIAWVGAASMAAGAQPSATVPDAMSAQRRIVEELDKISQNKLRLQFPQFSIKVLGTELVDGELLFRIKMLATQGAPRSTPTTHRPRRSSRAASANSRSRAI